MWGVAGRCQCCGVGGHPAQDATWHPASIGSLLGARAALDVFFYIKKLYIFCLSIYVVLLTKFYICVVHLKYNTNDNNTVKRFYLISYI